MHQFWFGSEGMDREASRGLKKEQRHHGPAFCDEAGHITSSQWYERGILEHFQMIQVHHPDLISQEVQVLEEYG
jgi:hypothetical protein